jgi:ABC-type branched-subunit amino acid transport system substrate-binding protein
MPLVSIESFGLAQDPTVFEGSWFVDSRVPEITFRERFKREFKREVTAGVGHAYATVRMLASSLTSSRNREDAARRFRLISSFPSVIGPLTVLPSGVIWSEASRKIIRSGKIELINEPLQ